jgi:hypothetical protein
MAASQLWDLPSQAHTSSQPALMITQIFLCCGHASSTSKYATPRPFKYVFFHTRSAPPPAPPSLMCADVKKLHHCYTIACAHICVHMCVSPCSASLITFCSASCASLPLCNASLITSCLITPCPHPPHIYTLAHTQTHTHLHTFDHILHTGLHGAAHCRCCAEEGRPRERA